MLLIEIRKMFERNPTLSFFELKTELKANVKILKQGIEFWIKKGKIKKASDDIKLCCTSGTACNKCNITEFELYSWIE